MYTSDKRINNAYIYLGISVFLAFFGAVYEYFSHGVWSYYMVYAFAVPLLGGAVPCLISLRRDPYNEAASGASSSRTDAFIWRAALATLTLGSIMKGVLDIYGTANSLITVYPVLGAALALTALILNRKRARQKTSL